MDHRIALTASLRRNSSAVFFLVALVCVCPVGCQALTNPVADGIPVRRLPPEVLAYPKRDEKPVPLSLLRQKQPDAYRLDSGDVLGIWIETILGSANQPPPVLPSESPLPPAIGFPIVVHTDGTITLPIIKPIKVRGMSLPEVQQAILDAYTVKKQILPPDKARVIVTLQKRRTYHILVVRDDSNSMSGGNVTGGLFGIGSIGVASGTSGRGTGNALDLAAYENDVMNALTKSGGLPGFGGADEVIVERGSYLDGSDPSAVPQRLKRAAGKEATGISEYGARIVRIPLRIKKNESPPFKPEDIILTSGDIVYVPSRDADVFYTGGLLFTGQYSLPRDYDLGVVEAIAVTRGTLVNGGFNSLNNLSGSSSGGGTGAGGALGEPNPSLVSVIRRLPNNTQVTIRVDLNRALRDPRENIIIQPNDIVILQNTPGEALTRYITRTLRLDLLGTFVRQRDLTGTVNLTAP